jgi:hypothetical protein
MRCGPNAWSFEQERETDDERDDPQDRAAIRRLKAKYGGDGDGASDEAFPGDEVIRPVCQERVRTRDKSDCQCERCPAGGLEMI